MYESILGLTSALLLLFTQVKIHVDLDSMAKCDFLTEQLKAQNVESAKLDEQDAKTLRTFTAIKELQETLILQ